MLNINDALHKRAKLREQAKSFIAMEEKGKTLSADEKFLYEKVMNDLQEVNEAMDKHAAGAHFGNADETQRMIASALPGVRGTRRPSFGDDSGLSLVPGKDSSEVESALEVVKAFVRTGKIQATDTPLNVQTAPVSGGTAAAIPTFVLDVLRSYFLNDAFRLAGSTIYNTETTQPLIKPIISAGPDAEVFQEGSSATDSHPMQVDSFTFHGDKYARLVKVSELALMNSGMDLSAEILGELAAGVVNTFTKVITTGLMAALESYAAVTYVDRHNYVDIYGALLGLLMAVPPRYDDPQNTAFMCSRADLRIIKDVRSTQNEPLFDPEAGTIFGRKVVINDNLNRVVYGNWQAGSFVRKSPFILQRLIELYSAAGQIGFKATQFLDSKFLASVPAVTVQPLFFTNLETAGS